MLIVTLSCTILGDGDEEQSSDAESLKQTEIAIGIQKTLAAKEADTPTQAPPPTQAPAPTQPPAEVQPSPTTEISAGEPVPTETPPLMDSPGDLINPGASSSGDIYYEEAFEEMPGWSVFQMRGNANGFSYEIFDNRLRTDIQTQDTWVYYFFEGGGDFQDVRIDITAQNRASNTNFVGMICRYSEQGWYEANILNTGEYAVFYGGPEGLEDTIYKGNSRLIQTGQKSNSYTMICRGELLTLYINGVEVYSLPLRTGDYRFLESGQVGLSVSTSYAIPVVVDFLEFILSVP
jgi:hypothetical protein